MMKNRDYCVLINFDKPWIVRCRLESAKSRNPEKYGYPIYRDVTYLPVYSGSKSKATKIANHLKKVNDYL